VGWRVQRMDPLGRRLAAGALLEQIGVRHRHRPRQAGTQSGTSPRVVARAFRELASSRRQLGTSYSGGSSKTRFWPDVELDELPDDCGSQDRSSASS
jgi:hypothetical protein